MLWPLPRKLSYPLLGAALAFGAPFGLILVEAVRAGVLPNMDFRHSTVAASPHVYTYLWLSTSFIFVMSGYLVGRREDGLQHVSFTDPLTGLWNRRYLRKRLDSEIRRVQRRSAALSLLLLDVVEL